DKVAQLGKLDDFFFQLADIVIRYTQQAGVQIDITAATEFRMETGAELQQGCNLATDIKTATARLQSAYQRFHQCGFPGTIVTDDAQAFTFQHIKGNILQHMEYTMARFAQQQLQQAILGPRINAVVLAQVFDGDTVHYKTSPKACLI